MKKFSKFFMSMLAMCSIAACSNDELGNEPVVDPGASTDAVYMNVTVQLPTGPGTRSETDTPSNGDYGTSSGGTEVGKDRENVVKKVLLVLAKTKDNGTEDEIIAYGVSEGDQVTSVGTAAKSTHKIQKTDLAKYYGNDGMLEKNQIKVYVFCNPTPQLISIIKDAKDATWVDKTAKITETPAGVTVIANEDGNAIWGGEGHELGFLMSTAKEKDIIKLIPKNLKAWEVHKEANKAFDLSGKNNYTDSDNDVDNKEAISVERSVARFDFKDGSKGNYTYDVVKEKGKTLVQIKLVRMALVNMSKEFYYLRRTSDDGLNANNTLCGVETEKNYVVDTDAAAKQGNMATFDFENHFNFCLGDGTGAAWTINEEARGQWYNTVLSDIKNNEEDGDEGWEPEEGTNKEGYRIWRYVTENTIPKPLTGKFAQRHGISTGIVFKGKMIATSDADENLKKAINNEGGILQDDNEYNPILYAYGNNLFYRWGQVRDYALSDDADAVVRETIFGSDVPKTKDDYSTDVTSPDYLWKAWDDIADKKSEAAKAALKAFKNKATSKQITLYQSSSDEVGGETDNDKKGYYCYYYYWNRHNNNGQNGNMGNMEFAVVRNNVYKLAVTKISQLGHPRISENDPDPEDPEKPDESDNLYLTLSVKVLPWVVRVNNIEF